MLHGCQKQMIHVRTTDNRFFEEAYLVLRPGAADGRPAADLVAEAQRLVKESLGRLYPSGTGRRRRFLLPYLGGFFSAAGIFALSLVLSRLF